MKKSILMNDIKPGKTIVVRSGDAGNAGNARDTDAEAALRAIRAKIEAIGSHLDRSAATLGRLEAKLGEAS